MDSAIYAKRRSEAYSSPTMGCLLEGQRYMKGALAGEFASSRRKHQREMMNKCTGKKCFAARLKIGYSHRNDGVKPELELMHAL